MNNETFFPNQRETLPKRLAKGIPAAIGGIVLTAALSTGAWRSAIGWSPTSTARRCFYFPEYSDLISSLPDRDEIKQFLLMKSFFGSDSLYFDLGDENTGETHLTPAESSDKTPPQSSIEAPDGIPEDADIYSYDYTKRRAGELALLPYDHSGKQPGELLLTNTTAYEIDPSDYPDRDYPITSRITEEPLVLIVHTHGTEAFAPEGEVSVKAGSSRSSDPEKNIVAVGKVMSDLLNESGIPTIHCETMHDLESYRASYDLCADTIREYLAKYPSIKYVFDVHRDAIIRQNGDIVKPVCNINGSISAQVMLLVGTNEKGADHPEWESNLTIASKLQSKLIQKYKNFARPINIRGASFNEQFTKGSLLIEIGSSGNTLSEAKYAAKLLTYSIIEMIGDNQERGK